MQRPKPSNKSTKNCSILFMIKLWLACESHGQDGWILFDYIDLQGATATKEEKKRHFHYIRFRNLLLDENLWLPFGRSLIIGAYLFSCVCVCVYT